MYQKWSKILLVYLAVVGPDATVLENCLANDLLHWQLTIL